MPGSNTKLRVAIVHDWFVGWGAEQVVLELHRLFPDAPIYTSYCNDEWRRKLDGKVVTGYLQRWPFSRLRKFLPVLRIWWFSHLNLSGYDLVISSSGAEAKGVRVPAGTMHIGYCHAPTHYYWSRYDEYVQRPGFGALDPIARLGLAFLLKPLRRWDYAAAQRPDYLIANSTHIQQEIKRYYDRDSTVIFPPVDTEFFAHQAGKTKRAGFVAIGRQTPYKRIDLAVEACTKLDLPLTVIGRGPDHERLVRMAGPTVTFITNASRQDIRYRLQTAEALIFPGLDDFGITPVEAMAAGTPVIAYRGGGALDYVVESKTGLFFDEQTAGSLIKVLKSFSSESFKPKTIQAEAQKFSIQEFRKHMTAFIAQKTDSSGKY